MPSSYLFDVFLGANYNQSPPNVKYMTVSEHASWPPVFLFAARQMGVNTVSTQIYMRLVRRSSSSVELPSDDLRRSGRQGVLVPSGDLGRARLDRWQIDPVTGLHFADSGASLSGLTQIPQVLISIQSMILCEEPYLNEPGWAGSAGTPQSRACERRAKYPF